MIYLLYGDEEFLIEEEIKKIIKTSKVDDLNISRYDLEEDNIKDVIDDANTVSLFEDNKVIIVRGLDKYLKLKDTKILEDYINNIVPETNLILTAYKLDDKKKIVKDLKKISKVKECNKNKNISNAVRQMFDDYKIDYKTIDLLIKLVGSDLAIIKQEAEKLKTYKTDKIITSKDVLELVSDNCNEDIFDLVNYIVNKDKESAFNTYSKLIKKNEEPIKIIITLANQFRLIYQAKELYKKGCSQDTIADTLSVHPYRIKLALEKSKNYSSKILLNYLLKLADIDSKIKNGLIDKNLALELFILEN